MIDWIDDLGGFVPVSTAFIPNLGGYMVLAPDDEEDTDHDE